MKQTTSDFNTHAEGYVYGTYGDIRYLKHAVASVTSLRRYDQKRPTALYCSKSHLDELNNNSLDHHFTQIHLLPEENQSITGFKHHLYKFLPFEKTLFIDSDILWCKDPDNLWKSLSAYRFTITGNQSSDLFFGTYKGFGIFKDILLSGRKRTLKRFGLSYLSRVQAGMIYSSDADLTRKVCNLSVDYFEQKDQTHFRSRIEEEGRNEESCEWSLAMAMAKLKLQVFPWLNGYESPQLDFIENFTLYDEDFRHVECLLYTHRFVYDLKGLKSRRLQSILIRLLTMLPGRGDSLYVTPYCLHFGWVHQKEPLNLFAEKCWNIHINTRQAEEVSSL